jgi:DNA-binding MarR family transcriptional regulator
VLPFWRPGPTARYTLVKFSRKSISLNNVGPYLSRLAPLLPQLVIAYRRRGADIPEALRRAGGLGQRHVGVLITVAISGPLSVSELAQRTGMTVAHASLVAGELARAGLVVREHDERDRRRIIVSLADAARPAIAEMRGRYAEPVARFLSALEEEQAEQFIRHLGLLLAHLRDEAPPGQPAAGQARG